MKRLFPIITFCAIAVSGCSSGPLVSDAPIRNLPGGFPNHTAEEIMDSLRAELERVHSYSTDGSIEIVRGDESHSGGLGLRARVEDSLSAVVRGPLGIIAGRALLTRDSVFFTDRINGNDHAGATDDAQPFPAPFSSFLSEISANDQWLIGLVAPVLPQPWDVRTDSLRYVMTRLLPSGEEERIVVDPAIWRVVSYTLQYESRIVKALAFSDFDTVDGFVVPRRVILEFPDEQFVLRMTHDRVQVNPDELRIANWRK